MDKTAKEYGTMASTANVGELNGEVYGLFYHARVRHISPNIPYRRPPSMTLCGRRAGVATREIHEVCPECQEKAVELLGTLIFK